MDERDRPLETAIQDLMARKAVMVSRFLDVATRHVARKDEYGMERWRDLPKLIHCCISRLGEADGFEVHLDSHRNYKDGSIVGLGLTAPPGSEFGWLPGTTADSYVLVLPDKGILRVTPTAMGRFEVFRQLDGENISLGDASDLRMAIVLADNHVPLDCITLLRNDALWRAQPPSDAQLGVLRRLYPELLAPFTSDADFYQRGKETYSRGEVSRLISVRDRKAAPPHGESPVGLPARCVTRHFIPGRILYAKLFGMLEAAFRTHFSSLGADSLEAGNTQAFSGTQFELRIALMLEKYGCQCEMTPVTGDQGADLIVHYGARKIAVQVKWRSGTVGNGAVQEVLASQKLYHCREAWVITNSTFTKSARELAIAHDIVLVEGTELGRLQSILDSGLDQRQRTLFGG